MAEIKNDKLTLRFGGLRVLDQVSLRAGAGELLGVLLAPGANDRSLGSLVSQWGSDPVWVSQPVANRAIFLELDSLMRTLGLDDRPGDAPALSTSSTSLLPVPFND